MTADAKGQRRKIHDAACKNVFRLALTPSEKNGDFPWHRYADSERSSQALCVSAFGSLRSDDLTGARDRILAEFVGPAFSQWPADSLQGWHIGVEERKPEVLNEMGGGTPSSLDVCFRSQKALVTVEAKFVSDAEAGFGGCGMYHARKGERKCKGFHGRGSDLVPGTRRREACCRLTVRDGKRTPRRYWEIGKKWFREEVFREQALGEECPFRDANYQIMRNFLFAAEAARLECRPFFGLLVVCPRSKDVVLRRQLDVFLAEILRPEFSRRVALQHYEDLIGVLRSFPGPATELADFLEGRIATVLRSEGA